MKKFLALMALLLCFTVLFVACDNNDEPQSSENPTDPIVEPAGCEHAYDNACDATCNLCGEKRAPAAHVEETIAAVAPTCTKAGLTEGKVCTVCGVVTKAQEVDPATGHTTVTVAGTPATCTTAGMTDGQVCSVCDTVVVAQEVIFATGHNAVVVEGKAATCTEDGLTSGKKCSACDEWIQEQAVIPATGHAESTVPSVNPTCTEPGYVGATVCTVCNEVLKAERVIPALGHTEVEIPEVESTCTKAGSEGGMMCVTCGVVTVEPTPTKLAKHTPTRVYGYEATCITAGLTDGTVCKHCGVVIKEQVFIPATHGELVVLPALDPTCYTVGYTEGAMCSVCNGTVVAQTVIPNQHTYTYTCDTNCGICGYQRWEAPNHVHGITPKGAYGCIYECGEATYDILATPDSYTAGELLETMKNQVAYPNVGVYDAENGYITIAGASTAGDPGTDKVYSVANGASGRYVVLRYRTTDPSVTFRFVSYSPACAEKWHDLGTNGEWQTIVVDAGANYQGWMEFRCNIYLNGGASENAETNISHIATFADPAEAYIYASQLGRYVDGQCPHYEYEIGWGGSVICKYCYEEAVPTTSHVGAQIYNAIDPTCPDFALITDNGSQGVTVTGMGQGFGGNSANLKLTSDQGDFGDYLVTVYKVTYNEGNTSGFLAIANEDGSNFVTASVIAPNPGKWAVSNYDGQKTGAPSSECLEIMCNALGSTATTSIYAIYTFDSQAAAVKYAEMLSTKCFHDETAVNELGQTVCTACGTVRGATAEWPLDLESGFVTTPNFVAGTSMWDPGVQEYHYSYIAENNHKLVLDYYGDNISIIINGFYAPALSADVKAGDKVEVIVYANWDEETWTMIPDGIFFIVDKALPGSANNPFELVLGETTTPEFVLGTSMMDPGVQQYSYKWVAIDDGKLILSELENISWVKNGEWGEGYVVDVLKGDVVEITVFMGMDENWNWLTTPVTFSAEFDVVHRFTIGEDGSITCNKDCHEPMVPTTFTNAEALNFKINNLGTNLSTALTNNAFSYNEAEGYISVTGKDGHSDPGMDHVIAVHVGPSWDGGKPVIQRYLVIRYRTDTPKAELRFVTWNKPTMVIRPDMGTNGEWKTVVVDLQEAAQVGERIDIRCNIGANQTDFSHIVSFTTLEEANSYANQFGVLVDGACSHNGSTVDVVAPATCTSNGLNIIHCPHCGDVEDITAGGSHTFMVDDGVVSCVACGHVATASVHTGANLVSAVQAAKDNNITTGEDSVTIKGIGTGAFNTARITLNDPNVNFGEYVVIVYKTNAALGYLGITQPAAADGMVYNAGMAVSETNWAVYNLGVPTGAHGNELELCCNFGGDENTWTTIQAVYTFDSAEAAAMFVESCNYKVATSHVGANLVASVNSAEQGDAALMSKDDYSVTVTDIGGGALGTTRIRLKNETGANFGKYIVIVYKSNAAGYLGITNPASATGAGLDYNAGMLPSETKCAVYDFGLASGDALGSELELCCNFGGDANTWTTIYAVYTFDTAEDAAAFAAFIG